MNARIRTMAVSISAALAASIAPQASQAQVLEEVLVTAQKKEAAVNDVPITITALGAGDIKALRLTDATGSGADLVRVAIRKLEDAA